MGQVESTTAAMNKEAGVATRIAKTEYKYMSLAIPTISNQPPLVPSPFCVYTCDHLSRIGYTQIEAKMPFSSTFSRSSCPLVVDLEFVILVDENFMQILLHVMSPVSMF